MSLHLKYCYYFLAHLDLNIGGLSSLFYSFFFSDPKKRLESSRLQDWLWNCAFVKSSYQNVVSLSFHSCLETVTHSNIIPYLKLNLIKSYASIYFPLKLAWVAPSISSPGLGGDIENFLAPNLLLLILTPWLIREGFA